MPKLADIGLSGLLEALEAPAPSAAGGTAAAVVAAMAASLVAMIGRGSAAWPDGLAVATDAVAARDRLLTLGTEDIEAFAAVLAAYRSSSDPVDALVHAAEVPLEIAERAADVVELATRAAAEGSKPMRPDAGAAAILAVAAMRAAAQLVGVNLGAVPEDRHAERKSRLLTAARAAEERVAQT